MSTAKDHLWDFDFHRANTKRIAEFVNEHIDKYGCEKAFGTLISQASFVGHLDADLESVPKGHPAGKAVYAALKSAVSELKKAEALYERRCLRKPRQRKRRK